MAMTRRTLLAGAAAGGLAACGLTTHSHGGSSDERPNILLAIADDWSWPHASACGDPVIATPAFDRVAREGVLFTHAFTAAPTCTASRGSLLTGQAPHRLAEGANLHSILRPEFRSFPDLLEEAGYFVGCTGKGWSPGSVEKSGRTRNPAGPGFKSFARFLEQAPKDRPFFFWFGSHLPHRPYEQGSGARAGLDPAKVRVPPFLPDDPAVRSDLLDYYLEARRFDESVGDILAQLDASGRASNTIVAVTSDNGLPFPRAKANVYDAGTREPLAIRWPSGGLSGKVSNELVSLTDLAPTFLRAAGLEPLPAMTGQSILPLISGSGPLNREMVFIERERHAFARRGNLSYPCRAIRTREFLYIRNLRPGRWPAGDPEKLNDLGPFSDIDSSPTKRLLLEGRTKPGIRELCELATAKRPAEELYHVANDPWQMNNLAVDSQYSAIRNRLRAKLDEWLTTTADPRILNDDDRWDKYEYHSAKVSL
jgi:arylsulfatase A-like enzyme